MVWRERAPERGLDLEALRRGVPRPSARTGFVWAAGKSLMVLPAQEPAATAGGCGPPGAGMKARAGPTLGRHSHPANRKDLRATIGRSSVRLFPGRVTALKICCTQGRRGFFHPHSSRAA